MPKSFGCQYSFPLCGSLALAALLVSGSCTRTAKSMLNSRLSSAELAPLAIPGPTLQSGRSTPQRGGLNSSQCSEGTMHNGPTW